MTMPATLLHPNAQALRAYQSENSEQMMIERNLPLVKTTVDRMRVFLPPTLDMDDLYSAGITGLIAAARKFDPTQGAAFATFATLHIRGAVHDELRRMDWMPRSARDKAKAVKETLAALEQRLGRAPADAEACEALGVSAAEYEELLEEIRPATFVPLDGAAFQEDADAISLHDLIKDDTQVPAHQTLDRKELIGLVVEQLKKLPDVPKKVLAMYYFEDMRLAEIAAAFGVTEGRISQIHTQAVLSLRAFIRRATAPPCS